MNKNIFNQECMDIKLENFKRNQTSNCDYVLQAYEEYKKTYSKYRMKIMMPYLIINSILVTVLLIAIICCMNVANSEMKLLAVIGCYVVVNTTVTIMFLQKIKALNEGYEKIPEIKQKFNEFKDAQRRFLFDNQIAEDGVFFDLLILLNKKTLGLNFGYLVQEGEDFIVTDFQTIKKISTKDFVEKRLIEQKMAIGQFCTLNNLLKQKGKKECLSFTKKFPYLLSYYEIEFNDEFDTSSLLIPSYEKDVVDTYFN